MYNKCKPILLIVLLLLLKSLLLLSACSAPATHEDNGETVVKMQQQLEQLKPKADASTSASASDVPEAAAMPSTPDTQKAPTKPVKPTTPNGVLASDNVVLEKLTIIPSEVKTGEVVTVSINVRNISHVEGSYRLALIEKMVAPRVASDGLEYANLVTLKPGETKTITFIATKKNVAGTYSVEITYSAHAVPIVADYTVLDVTPPGASSD